MTQMSPRVCRCMAAAALCLVVLVGAMPEAVVGAGRSASADLTATYDVDATVSWANASIVARTTIHVTNTSGQAIDRLQLNTIAGPLGGMRILTAKVRKKSVQAEVDEQTILLPIPGGLSRGEQVTVFIKYRAQFRGATAGLSWIFSKADGIIAAARWIPWVSRKRDFRNVGVGDPYFTTSSPRVSVEITTDRPLIIASTGRRVSVDGLTQTYVARNVRDFNFSAAPDFDVLRAQSVDGQTGLVVYTRTASASRRQQIMSWARQAFDAFEDKVGRYPYPRFVISESPGGTALESPGLIWLGQGAINGGNAYFLTVHETAHQWFYGIVGNDQPRQPFADEAASEFLTRWYMGNFRASQCPQDDLDGSVYAYGSCYYETLYVQGASFLNEIRMDIGSDRFWRALRGYWQAHRFELGSTFALLEALREAARQVDVHLRPRYMKRFPSLY